MIAFAIWLVGAIIFAAWMGVRDSADAVIVGLFAAVWPFILVTLAIGWLRTGGTYRGVYLDFWNEP